MGATWARIRMPSHAGSTSGSRRSRGCAARKTGAARCGDRDAFRIVAAPSPHRRGRDHRGFQSRRLPDTIALMADVAQAYADDKSAAAAQGAHDGPGFEAPAAAGVGARPPGQRATPRPGAGALRGTRVRWRPARAAGSRERWAAPRSRRRSRGRRDRWGRRSGTTSIAGEPAVVRGFAGGEPAAARVTHDGFAVEPVRGGDPRPRLRGAG